MVRHLQYNFLWKSKLSQLDLELTCFRENHPTEKGGLGAAGHFRNVVEMLWGSRAKEFLGREPIAHISWNPWFERMAQASCQHKYMAVLGCANSSKTTFFAIWAIVNWLASPAGTLVLVTSTSLKESRRRIWGKVAEYFTSIPDFPGKLLDSVGTIRTVEGEAYLPETCGIAMIAGERKKERESIGRLIGLKNKRVFLICDEMPELSPALIAAGISNLSVNPFFQLVGIGNFASIFDPLGELAKPKDGYAAITPDDEEWETELGYCIRFDGLKSPNILRGEDRWPEIYNTKNLINHRRTLGGDTTALFWRMVRSFPCPEGEEHVIYSEADSIRGRANESPHWEGMPIKIAGVDPAFATGGDRFAVCIALFGRDVNGKTCVAIEQVKVLYEDVTSKDPRDIQMAQQLVKLLKDEGVKPQHVGYDASGPGGLAFGSILSALWSRECLPIKFGGKASTTPVSMDDPRTGEEAFYNRRSEVWFVSRQPLRDGQIKHIPLEVAKEMKSVRYVTEKAVSMRIRVEPKDDTRQRIGASPDMAESFFMAVDVARQRLGFNLGTNPLETVTESTETFDSFAKRAHEIYSSVNYGG